MGAGIQKHPRFRTSVPVGLVTPSGDVEEFNLEDISLGGLFVRTLVPAPAGSFVRLRLPLSDGELSLMGRVVHVIDDDDARAKARARGMGVQFDGLAPETERRLAQFVGGLVEEQKRRRDDEGKPRFIDDNRVHVPADRATLARLWAAGLERGMLTALTPRAGGRVRGGLRVAVGIGPLRLTADVVVVDQDAAGLRFVDLRGAARTAIAAFIAGEAEALEEVRPAPTAMTMTVAGADAVDIRPVLADARRLLAHIEIDDLYRALGVDEGVPEAQLLARVRSLSAACTAARAHATPPQRARLDAALRELLALEGTMCGPPIVVGALIEETVRAQVGELVAEADFLASTGQPVEAQQALLEAKNIAPDSSGVHRRLERLDGELRDLRDLRDNAEALLDGAEQLRREELIARTRAVSHASTSRTVLLRAMRMLANAGAHDDMLAVAQHLADLDATDELPLFAMMQVNERLERFGDALRAGEALLRMRPDDYALQDRIAALAARVRR